MNILALTSQKGTQSVPFCEVKARIFMEQCKNMEQARIFMERSSAHVMHTKRYVSVLDAMTNKFEKDNRKLAALVAALKVMKTMLTKTKMMKNESLHVESVLANAETKVGTLTSKSMKFIQNAAFQEKRIMVELSDFTQRLYVTRAQVT